jgi:RHS repeat-associated protein
VGTQDIILALNWNGKAALASGLISDPNGPDSPVGYCGYLLNAETGLYTVRFRHYDPVWGRWVERDPAEFANGMHLLAYVENSPSSRSDSTGKDWRVNPVPAPIVPRPVPPTHEREREENGIVYLTRGKWNSKWIVNAWVKRDWQNPDCCELSISGNLIDRWYWADSADAQQEELWELKREEHYWDDLMQGLAAWKWATQGFVIPCDMAELAATLIQTGSNWNSDQATVDINREDMRNHPNPGYERSLEDAKRRARDAKNAFNATKRQLKNVMNEYKSGKANPCDCKPSAGAG